MRLRSATLTSGTPVARRARLMSEMVSDSPASCGAAARWRARRRTAGPARRRPAAAERPAAADARRWPRRGDHEAGDRRRGIRGGKPVERFDERLQRRYGGRSSVPSARATTSLRPPGTRNSLPASWSGRRASRSCATRTTGRPPAATGPSTDTLPLLERRTTCAEGTPAIWPRTTCSATSRTIVTASYGRSRTPAAARSARETGPLGLGIAPENCDNPAIRNGRAITAMKAVVISEGCEPAGG